jgi:hypothetical protein
VKVELHICIIHSAGASSAGIKRLRACKISYGGGGCSLASLKLFPNEATLCKISYGSCEDRCYHPQKPTALVS